MFSSGPPPTVINMSNYTSVDQYEECLNTIFASYLHSIFTFIFSCFHELDGSPNLIPRWNKCLGSTRCADVIFWSDDCYIFSFNGWHFVLSIIENVHINLLVLHQTQKRFTQIKSQFQLKKAWTMQESRWWLGLCPRPRWGSSNGAPPDPLP